MAESVMEDYDEFEVEPEENDIFRVDEYVNSELEESDSSDPEEYYSEVEENDNSETEENTHSATTSDDDNNWKWKTDEECEDYLMATDISEISIEEIRERITMYKKRLEESGIFNDMNEEDRREKEKMDRIGEHPLSQSTEDLLAEFKSYIHDPDHPAKLKVEAMFSAEEPSEDSLVMLTNLANLSKSLSENMKLVQIHMGHMARNTGYAAYYAHKASEMAMKYAMLITPKGNLLEEE